MAAHHSISKRKLKGAIFLPEKGYIDVLAFVSNAQIPLENVAITVTAEDGTAIAMRLTDRNGRIPIIEIPVPNRSNSQSPNSRTNTFTPVNVYARLEGYEHVENKNLQVFADTVTRLDLELIPLSTIPDNWDMTAIYDTPPQNL